jgi:hypothetical protein
MTCGGYSAQRLTVFHHKIIICVRLDRIERRLKNLKDNRIQQSLKKFGKVIRGLDLDKRITAIKWLEGVIVAQSLTTEERDILVKASNDYIGSFEDEKKYQDAVNALIEYFSHEQKKVMSALKKRKRKKRRKH